MSMHIFKIPFSGFSGGNGLMLVFVIIDQFYLANPSGGIIAIDVSQYPCFQSPITGMRLIWASSVIGKFAG